MKRFDTLRRSRLHPPPQEEEKDNRFSCYYSTSKSCRKRGCIFWRAARNRILRKLIFWLLFFHQLPYYTTILVRRSRYTSCVHAPPLCKCVTESKRPPTYTVRMYYQICIIIGNVCVCSRDPNYRFVSIMGGLTAQLKGGGKILSNRVYLRTKDPQLCQLGGSRGDEFLRTVRRYLLRGRQCGFDSSAARKSCQLY